MKKVLWIVGGAALVSGGVWFYVRYNSAEQRRLRSLSPGGGNTIAARNQQAGGGTTATIFHEPNLEPVSVDLSNIGGG